MNKMNIFSNPKIRWSVISFFVAVQIAIFNGNLGNIMTGIRTSVTLWGLVLMTGLPVFILGFGIRCLTLKFFIKG